MGNASRNLPLISRHSQRTSNPKRPNFLIETRRLSESFEGLNSSLAQWAGVLWHLPKLAKYTFCGILLQTENQAFDP